MSVEYKFAITIAVIVGSTLVGYLARRFFALRESLAKPLMTAVTVLGYPSVGLLAVWKLDLQWADAWLPMLGGLQATIQVLFALFVGRWLIKDRQERGLLGFSCGIGNHGITMVGFVVFLLMGEQGLGRNTMYALYTFFALVLLSYPVARHFAPKAERKPLWRLLNDSLWDIRSIGLVACIAGLALSATGVPRPAFVTDWHIVEICMYGVIIAAYFAIGLRLQLPHLWEIRRAIAMLISIRHGFGLLVGFALLGLTMLTPLPLEGMTRKVFLLNASVPMGVMGVAVANMFHIKPAEASAMFVVSSIAYLAIGLPIILMLFG